MKHLLTILAIGFLSVMKGYSQKKINLQDAANFVGDTVRICERVVSSNFLTNIEGRPTYLTLGGGESQVVVVIRGESRRRFDYKPEKDLLNRNICVTGRIESIGGRLQMIVSRQDEINLSANRR